MKKFFSEFKKFISRGNVMDMAVGTIVGAAFTAIVTALSNGILKPIINMIIYYACGGNKDALSKMYTMLVPVYTTEETAEGAVEEVIDLANSIYIDWGAFISAIINFLLVAIVLFLIIRAFNNVKDSAEKAKNMENIIKIKQSKNIKLTKKEQAYLDEKAKKAEEEAKKANEPQPEPAKDPVVVLLEEIRDSLKTKEETK